VRCDITESSCCEASADSVGRQWTPLCEVAPYEAGTLPDVRHPLVLVTWQRRPEPPFVLTAGSDAVHRSTSLAGIYPSVLNYP
jgi:hypothetical protein